MKELETLARSAIWEEYEIYEGTEKFVKMI